VKESNTYLLVKVIHRTFAASQNVVKPWIWIFSYENVAKVKKVRKSRKQICMFLISQKTKFSHFFALASKKPEKVVARKDKSIKIII
jgi:hypothetical protein